MEHVLPDVPTQDNSCDCGVFVLEYAERVVGMHFFNPVHIMKLVEVVVAEQSSEEAVDCAVELSKRIAKDPMCSEARFAYAIGPAGLVPPDSIVPDDDAALYLGGAFAFAA